MVSINPADCGPDEAYVGTVYGKRYFMQRTDLSNDSRDHPWLAVRHDRAYPCSTDKEWVADEMVSDLTRLVPYDRGGVPGPTWAERERDEWEEKYLDADKALHDMRLERDGWRDRYRALQSEYARQSQAWSEKRADYEQRLAAAEEAEAPDPVEERAREIETKVRDVLSGVMTPLAQITDSPAGVYLDDLIPDGWDREFYRDMARRALGEEDRHVDQ